MDIHSTFETLAEAWVAASTPTAVNPEPKPLQKGQGGGDDDDDHNMLPKEQNNSKPTDNLCDNDALPHHHHHQHQQQQQQQQHNSDDDEEEDDDTGQPGLEQTASPAGGVYHSATTPPVLRASPTLTPLPVVASLGVRSGSCPKTPSPRKFESAGPGIAAMPIRCIIEHVNGAVNFDNATSASCDVTAVEEDTFAILPVTTPLRDLVRTALAKLGYSSTDALNAKGAIQLKNWKPLTFDVITDDKSATIDDILRELKEYTLRIRLSSQPRLSSVEEMKEKLLQLLLTTSQSMLMDTGCPVEKTLLMSLSKGDNFADVSEDMVSQFDSWYHNQISKNPKALLSPPATTTQSPATTTAPAYNAIAHDDVKREKVIPAESQQTEVRVKEPAVTPNHKLPSLSSSSSSVTPLAAPSSHQASSQPTSQFVVNGASGQQQQQQQQQFPQQQSHLQHPVAPHGPVLTPSKTRIRTSFDPEHEIPRLQKWFQDNQHPTREQMVRFMSELNNLDSRKGRRPLDLTNIIYWFKNARAAQRRATKALDDSFENEENVDVGVSGGGAGASNSSATNGHGSLIGGGSNLPEPPPAPQTLPPYLPNKNAVYIVPYPYHTAHHAAASSSNPHLAATPEPLGGSGGGDSNDEPCDLSIKKLKDTTSNQQDPSAKAGQSGRGGGACVIKTETAADSGGGELISSHSHKDSPARNGYPSAKSLALEDGIGYKSPFGRLQETSSGRKSQMGTVPSGKDRRAVNGETTSGDKKLVEKRYQHRKGVDERDLRVAMDFKEDAGGDFSSDESVHSSDSGGGGGRRRLRIHEEDEDEEYARARSVEMRLAAAGMGALGSGSGAPTSETSMAALSLAQMSQPPLQIPMSHLAMYYNMPRYYHHPSASHHHHPGSASAAAAMAMAFTGSAAVAAAHMNGHGGAGSGAGSHHPNPNRHSSSSSSASNPQSPGRPIPIQPAPHPPLSHSHHGRSSSSSEPRKRRTRVFIDPLTEIPKLEKWFLEDTHPSAYMIDKYTETLNGAEYRQKFPKLEPKNIQLWFKNHRAKVKRQRTGGSSCGGDESMCDSPPPPADSGSRSDTPVNLMLSGPDREGDREAAGSGGLLGSGGSTAGSSSSPDHASKHSDDAVDNRQDEEEMMEEGE